MKLAPTTFEAARTQANVAPLARLQRSTERHGLSESVRDFPAGAGLTMSWRSSLTRTSRQRCPRPAHP